MAANEPYGWAALHVAADVHGGRCASVQRAVGRPRCAPLAAGSLPRQKRRSSADDHACAGVHVHHRPARGRSRRRRMFSAHSVIVYRPGACLELADCSSAYQVTHRGDRVHRRVLETDLESAASAPPNWSVPWAVSSARISASDSTHPPRLQPRRQSPHRRNNHRRAQATPGSAPPSSKPLTPAAARGTPTSEPSTTASSLAAATRKLSLPSEAVGAL
jgi:hypothetical protein